MIVTLYILLAINTFGVTENHSCVQSIVATYQQLLPNIPLNQLHQLKEDPFRLPVIERIEDYSGYLPILKTIIDSAPQFFATEEVTPYLKEQIQKAIAEKSQNTIAQAQSNKIQTKLPRNFDIKAYPERACGTISPCGSILYSGGIPGNLCLWNPQTGEALKDKNRNRIIHKFGDGFIRMRISPDGKIIYALIERELCNKFFIAFIDSETGLILKDNKNESILIDLKMSLDGSLRDISPFLVSPDGATLFIAKYNRIYSYDARTGSFLKKSRLLFFDILLSRTIKSFLISPDGAKLFAGTNKGMIDIFDATTLKKIESIKSDQKKVTALAISSDGKTLYSGGELEDIISWNLESHSVNFRTTKVLDRKPIDLNFKGAIDGLALSKDESVLFSGSRSGFFTNGSIDFYDPKSGALLGLLPDSQNTAVSISDIMAPEGDFVMSADGDTMYFFSITGEIKARFWRDFIAR